jgi:hypothetical protein
MSREHILIDTRHGGPYDRGRADSYYHRDRDPHYYAGATGQSTRIEHKDMTIAEIEAYLAGYEDNELEGDKKQW